MANLTKMFLSLALLLPGVIAAQTAASPLLQGVADVKEPKDVTFVYDFKGDTFVETVKMTSDGKFNFAGALPMEEVDVMIYVGSSPYGAHLKKGTTTVMAIGENATFTGDNVAESKFFNKYIQAFYPLNYKPAGDAPFVFEDGKKLLESEKSQVNALIPGVKDSLKDIYSRMANSYYDEVMLSLLGMDKAFNGVDHNAEMDEIISRVDPNADESRLTGILNYWYDKSDMHRNAKANSILEYMIGQFDAIDKTLTNEGNKKDLWSTLGSMFMMYKPTDEDVEAFFAGVEPQLSRAPLVKEKILKARNQYMDKIKPGDAIPTDPKLISPDGKECHLSDLLGKTVVYIDIWATWCRPCVREIPFMEKVVEEFKGNDQITFISISRDDNKEAWLKKLDKDQPDWAQYIFDKKTGDEFMNAMGISGIPRFLLIGKDCKLIYPDAARPSDENIKDILNSAINK